MLGDIKKKYDTLTTDKQRAVFIQNAFGKADLDTIKGIKTLLSGDALERLSNFTKAISSAGGTLNKDFDEATNNLIDKSKMVKNDLREAADGFAQVVDNTLVKLIDWGRDKENGLGMDGTDMILGGVTRLPCWET